MSLLRGQKWHLSDNNNNKNNNNKNWCRAFFWLHFFLFLLAKENLYFTEITISTATTITATSTTTTTTTTTTATTNTCRTIFPTWFHLEKKRTDLIKDIQYIGLNCFCRD